MPLRTYLSNRTNQKRYRLNGYIPSKRMPYNASLKKDFTDHILFGTPQLPRKVDLRFQMTPVEDQSNSGISVANGFAATGNHTDVSRLFIYYNARVKDKESEENISDEGCTVTSALEALKESGTCLESVWPYDTIRVNKCPTDEAYEAAEYNTISDALQLDVNLHEMKSCLAQGFPFL